MAKRYFESTYTFHAEACIDYAYTCSKCGKPVSGVIKLPFSYGYRKTVPRREDLALTDAERRDGQAKAQSVMKSDLAIYRSRIEKGNYDLLRSVSTCPHCGAGQRWGHRPAKAIALLLMGVLLLAGTVVGAVMFFGKGGTLYTLSPAALIGGCMAGTLGVMMIPYSIIELRKTGASVGLAGSRPTVRFPQ